MARNGAAALALMCAAATTWRGVAGAGSKQCALNEVTTAPRPPCDSHAGEGTWCQTAQCGARGCLAPRGFDGWHDVRLAASSFVRHTINRMRGRRFATGDALHTAGQRGMLRAREQLRQRRAAGVQRAVRPCIPPVLQPLLQCARGVLPESHGHLRLARGASRQPCCSRGSSPALPSPALATATPPPPPSGRGDRKVN